MSSKQQLIDVLATLPESAEWSEITDTLLGIVARRGTPRDFARLYASQLSAEQLAEYLERRDGSELNDIVTELEASFKLRESA